MYLLCLLGLLLLLFGSLKINSRVLQSEPMPGTTASLFSERSDMKVTEFEGIEYKGASYKIQGEQDI